MAHWAALLPGLPGLCLTWFAFSANLPQSFSIPVADAEQHEAGLPGDELLNPYLANIGHYSTKPGRKHDSYVKDKDSTSELLPNLGAKSSSGVKLAPATFVPRCRSADDGSDDIFAGQAKSRRRRFVPHRKKWSHTSLTWRLRDPYKLFQYATDFKIVREVISEGFRLWAKATQAALSLQDITDDPNSGPADLDIFFALKDHGDHEPFDGTGGIVAHTGYPMEGKIHFDGSEFWTLNSDSGIDFRYVALHEIGHSLGLRHSHQNESVMYPIYRRADGMGELGLHRDDVRGIRYLYPLVEEETSTLPSFGPKVKTVPGGYKNPGVPVKRYRHAAARRSRRHARTLRLASETRSS